MGVIGGARLGRGHGPLRPGSTHVLAQFGTFPFALSFTPGSPPLVNSTPAFTSACLMSAAWYAVIGGSEATLSARATIRECTFARWASLDGSHPSSFRACLI